MSIQQIVDSFTETQGWSDSTLLDLCMEYIENQGANQAFQDFLSDKAQQENV